MSLVHVEYLKIAAYVLSGAGAARAWFAKEIKAGRAFLVKMEADAKAVEQKVVAEVKAVEKKL